MSPVLIVLWGCSSDPLSDSDDLLSAWTTDPAAVQHKLTLEADELKKLHQITFLSERFPGQTQELCALLQNVTDQDRCMQLNARPHLWAKETPQTSTSAPNQTISAIESGCPQDAVFHSCVSNLAQQAAQRGQIAQAQGLCISIDTDKWASECLFSAAEATVDLRGAHGYSQALELCLAADSFAENCLQHLVMRLAQAAPNANASSSEAWAPIFQAERAIQTSWSWRDAARAQRDVDRLWSEAIARAFASARPIGGGVLDILPADKRPFVHAAVVRKLMELEAPSQHTLEDWVQLTQTVLDQRHPQNDNRNTAQPWADYADLWVESSHDSIALIGTSRREYSSVPESDIAICVLETAARIPPLHQPLFAEAQDSPVPEIQRTAQRLMSLLELP